MLKLSLFTNVHWQLGEKALGKDHLKVATVLENMADFPMKRLGKKTKQKN